MAQRNAHDAVLGTMMRIYPDIVDDIILSRSVGDERMNYDEEYPNLDKNFLYTLINMVETIIDKASGDYGYEYEYDCASSSSVSYPDSP